MESNTVAKQHVILTVSNDLSYDQRMQKTAATLVQAGYQVTMVGRQRRQSRPLRQESWSQHRLWLGIEKGKLFYLLLNVRLFLYLLTHRFDVVCAVDLDTIMPAWWVARLKGKKVVYDAHEYFPEVPEVLNRPLVQSFWRWVERITVPRVDACYTVSAGLQQLFRQRHGVEFVLVPNYPPANAPQQHTTGQPYLLYQGALNEGRGLEQLLLAMYEIDIPLYLAGEGDLSQKLRELVVTMGLQGKVFFKGMLPPAELRAITAQATIGINLLENKGLSYYYSLSNKFFDYVQAGVPQLCIRFPEYDRLNKEQEVALMIDDLKAFTIYAAINRLLDDTALYARLQDNCRIAARKWTWEANEPVLKKLYQGLQKL